MSVYYDFYCDETAIDGGGSFYFGALNCTPARAEKLRQKIKKFRQEYGCHREMKWTKVSKKMLPAYVAFTNIFLDDPYARFIVMEVKRDKNWRVWAPNEEQRFFKAYYVFLRRHISSFARYGAYLDYKEGKWYRWKSLHFAVNKAIMRDHHYLRSKPVHTLKPLNSKKEDLLQLVDVLLGAITSNATALPKTQLAQHIRQHLTSLTDSSNPKFVFHQGWSPQIRK